MVATSTMPDVEPTGTPPNVVVLDYGAGNVRSAVRALEHAGANVDLTAEPDAVLAADGLVVPGVGAFAAVMAGLAAVDGVDMIRRRHARGQATLGICVGEQVLFSRGREHDADTAGVGLWPGDVTRLQAHIVPHMGWTKVVPGQASKMFAGLADEYFYFVHSYAAHQPPPGSVTSTAVHGRPFVAAVEDGPTWATQFHPEKSARAGAALLRNWLATL